MVANPQTPLARQARLLSKIIKLLRKERHMTAAEVAVGMGVSLRTYQDFEAGRRGYDFDKIRRFAKATRADATSIHLGVQYSWPELPVLMMDNKMATAFYILTRDLHKEVGPRLSRVPPGLLVSGFQQIGDEVRKLFARQDASAEDYIERAIAATYDDPADDPGEEG
jgi:transcriptional regulator with XRE-family HTH domain